MASEDLLKNSWSDHFATQMLERTMTYDTVTIICSHLPLHSNVKSVLPLIQKLIKSSGCFLQFQNSCNQQKVKKNHQHPSSILLYFCFLFQVMIRLQLNHLSTFGILAKKYHLNAFRLHCASLCSVIKKYGIQILDHTVALH